MDTHMGSPRIHPSFPGFKAALTVCQHESTRWDITGTGTSLYRPQITLFSAGKRCGVLLEEMAAFFLRPFSSSKISLGVFFFLVAFYGTVGIMWLEPRPYLTLLVGALLVVISWNFKCVK